MSTPRATTAVRRHPVFEHSWIVGDQSKTSPPCNGSRPPSGWAASHLRKSQTAGRALRVHTVVATLSIERLRRLCRFRRTAFGLVIG